MSLLSRFGASASSGSSFTNYGYDRLSSTTALVSSTSIVVSTYGYKPWGEANGGSGTTYNPFRYTGTYLDSATSLYQMGARYYQPTSGRCTQLDPLPNSIVSLNRYAGCNPANVTDPTGLFYCDLNVTLGHRCEAVCQLRTRPFVVFV